MHPMALPKPLWLWPLVASLLLLLLLMASPSSADRLTVHSDRIGELESIADVKTRSGRKGDEGREVSLASSNHTANATAEREAKILSIFSVVQFANRPCTSTSTYTKSGSGTTYRNGTCFTATECSQKGGTAAGTCAAGFGVCCVLAISSSGQSTNANCTYLRNPSFPSVYSGTSSVTYTLGKCNCDICWIRLDFECFTILGTGVTTEVNGGSCIDTFTATTPSGPTVPTICGQNTGQHIYLDVGGSCTNTATLTFTFTGTSSIRTWELKASQIPCNAKYAPPNGCLQYDTGLTGRITTFNFIPTNDDKLASQNYRVCIRQMQGYCCIQYMVCPDTRSMTLSPGAATMAQVDTLCTLDYLAIPGSSGTCSRSNIMGTTHDKYCGPFLNTFVMAVSNIAICDCTQPFEIGIYTDTLSQLGTIAANAAAMQSRGLCLTYTQIPCNM